MGGDGILPTKANQRVEVIEGCSEGLLPFQSCGFILRMAVVSYLEGSWLWHSGRYGWLGVEAFFVISGFIIPYSMYQQRYRVHRHLFTFMMKRIVRLDPPYFVAIALSVILWYASTLLPDFGGSNPTVSLPQLLAHVGYLNAFLGYEWLNPVFWTLAIEFQFYLFVAFFFPSYFIPLNQFVPSPYSRCVWLRLFFPMGCSCRTT